MRWYFFLLANSTAFAAAGTTASAPATNPKIPCWKSSVRSAVLLGSSFIGASLRRSRSEGGWRRRRQKKDKRRSLPTGSAVAQHPCFVYHQTMPVLSADDAAVSAIAAAIAAPAR